MEQLDVPRFRSCRRPCRLRHVRPVSWVARILPREARQVKGGGVRESKALRALEALKALRTRRSSSAFSASSALSASGLPAHRTRLPAQRILESDARDVVAIHRHCANAHSAKFVTKPV